MAQELETSEAQDKPLLEWAVKSIAESRELRLFVRRYLSSCGLLPLTSTFSPDPMEMARRAGQMQAGLNLLEMLNAADPMLWPALQLEDAKE